MTVTGGIEASVTLHVEIFDPKAMWDHAFGVYSGAQLGYKLHDPDDPTRLGNELHDEFVAMCGKRDDPDIAECLRMIFDPGESPPGVQIEDSSAEVVSLPSNDQYPLFIPDRGERTTDDMRCARD